MALALEYRVNALERVVNRLVFFMDTMLAEKSNPFIFGKSDGEQLDHQKRPVMETSVLQGAKELTATGSAAPDSFLHSNINLNDGANDSTGMIIDDHHPQVIEFSIIAEPPASKPSVIEPSVIHAGQLRMATAPNIPLNDRTNHSCEQSRNTTGLIIHNSFDESFKQLTANGDPHLERIVENLRREPAFERLHRWNPMNPVIRDARGQFIRWILHPKNIHKFKDPLTVLTTREKSPFGQLFRELFPTFVGTKEGRQLKKVLTATLQNAVSPLATFLAAVVKVHSEHCSACCVTDRLSD